jgi:hypothetical protein
MDMARSWKMRSELKSKATVTTLFLCAALSTLIHPDGFVGAVTGRQLVDVPAQAGPFVFLCAGVLVFLRPRWGYGLGVLGGLTAFTSFLWTESSFGDSSWVVLNATAGVMPGDRDFTAFVLLRILSGVLIGIAAVCSCLRLLPARWLLGKRPLCQSTWPAFAIGLVVMAVWFMHSVMPYRVPLIVDAGPAELRILHIEKRGLHFHETTLGVTRDGRVFVYRDDRRLFQFRWETRSVLRLMPQTTREHVAALLGSPELWRLHTAPAKHLWSWNAEGWYVVLKDTRLLAFTSEYRTEPPTGVTDPFREIEKLPGREQRSWSVQDVCLGLCYGPVAALGFQFSNQACFALARGATDCR